MVAKRFVRLAVVTLIFSASVADAADLKDRAREHFDAAELHYSSDRFQEALAEYQEAYGLFPQPGFLFNIAQCYRNLGRPADAISYFESYLAQSPDAPDRASVEGLIEELRHTPPRPPPPEPTETATQAEAVIPTPIEEVLPNSRPPWLWAGLGALVLITTVIVVAASSSGAPEHDIGIIDASLRF